jgi:hypothetical protein
MAKLTAEQLEQRRFVARMRRKVEMQKKILAMVHDKPKEEIRDTLDLVMRAVADQWKSGYGGTHFYADDPALRHYYL